MRPIYCSQCGGELSKSPDKHPHAQCTVCLRINYRNPTVGVAVMILQDNKILLVKRAIGDYAGEWCIPCGHLEYDEEVREAAIRELHEETGLRATITGVYDVHSNWHNREHQTVGIWFMGEVTGGELQAGDDASEVGFFPLTDLPPLCFPTDRLIVSRLISQL